MEDNKEFYILGLPIKTAIGECQFLKVKDYPDFYMHLQIVSMSKDHILNTYHKANKNGELDGLIGAMKDMPLIELIRALDEFKKAYAELFIKLFGNEDILENLTNDNFPSIRKMILDMNCVKEEKINPNPEIQAAIERSIRVKNQSGENLGFQDIVSSIVGFNGLTYPDLNEMTIYQLYMTFQRISQIKGYDTSTLFATVSPSADITSWCKPIDLLAEETHGMTRQEFDKKSDSIFG